MTNDTDHESDAELDRMLAASAPPVTVLTPDLENELARMSVAANARPMRTGTKAAVATLAVTLVLAGAGTAAAVTGGFTSWWADEPAGSYTFQVPSGITCEGVIGNVMVGTKDRAMATAAEEYLASIDIMSEINIDAEIAAMRADRDVWFIEDDGTRVPAWYGTDGYKTPDAEYTDAVWRAVSTLVSDELERQGFDLDFATNERGLSWEGELSCPGIER